MREEQVATTEGLIAKRLVVWSLEILSEAVLLAVLFIVVAFFTFGSSRSENLFEDFLFLFVSVLMAFIFYTGFFLTTAIFRLILGSRRWWLYPIVATALFLAHIEYFFRRTGGLPGSDRMALRLGGACIVFFSTVGGNRLLQKWALADGGRSRFRFGIGL